MQMYFAFTIGMGAIIFLVGLSFGILIGYHVLKSDYEAHHDYLEYLIHRQDRIRNRELLMESEKSEEVTNG